jgi:hypothetical protein
VTAIDTTAVTKKGECYMKREYKTPSVEVVKFQYRDQVVASSGCDIIYINIKDASGNCTAPEMFRERNI